MLSAFEKLPAELRRRIYEEVLPSGKFLVPCLPKMRYGLYPATRISAILATNRNIHADAGAYLYGNNIVDLDSTFSGYVGRPTSVWRRFGPSIQHVEISLTIDVIIGFDAVFCGQPLEIEELEHVWQWEKSLKDGIASTGLKSLAIDMTASIFSGPLEEERMVRKVALLAMLEMTMKDVIVERLTVRWLEWIGDDLVSKEKTKESQDESPGKKGTCAVKYLTITGLLNFGEAQVAQAILGR